MPKAKIRKEKNLLSNPEDEEPESDEVWHHVVYLVTF